MLKRLDLPFLLNHNLHPYLLRSLKLMHLSTHHPDLNNLFIISSLVSPTFNQLLNHLHPKNQDLKSKSLNHVQRLLPLPLHLQSLQKNHHKTFPSLLKQIKTQWTSIIIVLSRPNLQIPPTLLSLKHTIHVRPPLMTHQMPPLTLSLNMLTLPAY